MQRCFDLALNGAGHAAPNPLVGAVLVHDSKIIGEGYHAYFGGPHAEVNAIASVNEKQKKLLPHSTLFVNLEPCNHQGKTPPCTDLIINSGIKQVVIANRDPSPLVSGKGIARLKKAGFEVLSGICEEEGAWLNRRFFTFHQKKRPYIILKWAQSADGFFTKDSNEQHWITGERSKRLVHRWRSEEVAVMVGTNTLKVDNPKLTSRLWLNGKQPARIILDRNLELPEKLNVFNSSAPTIVFTEKKSKDKKNIRYIQTAFGKNHLEKMMAELYQSEILSVLVEGGAKLLNAFIEQSLWDEARIFTGKAFFSQGVRAPDINGKLISQETLGNDMLRILVID